jgi:hypothetical protein
MDGRMAMVESQDVGGFLGFLRRVFMMGGYFFGILLPALDTLLNPYLD